MKKELQVFNEKGWIPGPDEEKKGYLERIERLNHFFSYPPEDVDHFLTEQDWIGAKELTQHLYDFSPDWIVSHYSNQKLSFFQGAATWISEKEDLRIPLIQLKEKFEKGGLFGLYKRDEVLAHEAVHAARMQFDEPFFEEIFAYKTSPHLWRRFLGPIFQKPWEAYLFIILLLLPLGIEVSKFFDVTLGIFEWLQFLPAAYFLFLFGRLSFMQITLSLALKRLKKVISNPQRALAVALRLKDREIFQFAYLSKAKLEEASKSRDSFRFECIVENYFK